MARLTYRGGLAPKLAAGLLCLGLVVGCENNKAEVDPLEGYRVATVDTLTLMELHPDFSKLEQLNQKVAELQQERIKIEGQAREKLITEGGDEMAKAIEQAKKKLEAERAGVEAEIAALSNRLKAQIESEMRGIQAGMEKELEGEVAKLKGSLPKQTEAPPLDANIEGQVKDYMQNLMLVRERNLAAKRLELEKSVGDRIAAKKAEVDGQLAAFEAELAGRYQSERLNLQLTAQNSTDEDAKAQAEVRLGEIANEIEQAKSAKRQELEGGYAAVRAEETAQLQEQLKAYQQKLDAEVAQKVDQKRREIGLPSSQPVAAATNSGPPPEIQQKINELQARMRSQLAARQAQLKGQLEAKMEQSRKHLEAKQQQVEEELQKLEIDIQKRIATSMKNLPEDVQKRMTEVEEEIKTVTEESKKLMQAMREDINGAVAGIAEKKNEEMVLGLTPERTSFYKDPSFTDLTDLAQVRVQQLEKK